MLNVIDLFAGAGGLSEGFRQAGFNIISHIEMDRSACATLRTREAYYFLKESNQIRFYEDYLMKKISRSQLYEMIPNHILDKVIETEINDENFIEIISRVDQSLSLLGENEIDVVIGGPPCQAFSTAGISRDPDRMRNDPRNFLYKQYVRFIVQFKPKVFIFENVKGIINAQNGEIFEGLRKELAEANYKIEYKVLNTKDFNVSQNRQRVILIGWRKEYSLSYPKFKIIPQNIYIRDLFNDLPALNNGEIIDGKRKYKRNAKIANTFIRSKEWDILSQHISRPNNENDLEIYKIMVKNWNKNQKLLKYNELPMKNQTHNNREIFLDRYKIINYDNISHTIVAHISKDGHYYIHPDLKQNRSITVREAARIQSFPDNFYFEDSRTAAFKQIGNAVPPLMAYHIAEQLKTILKQIN